LRKEDIICYLWEIKPSKTSSSSFSIEKLYKLELELNHLS